MPIRRGAALTFLLASWLPCTAAAQYRGGSAPLFHGPIEVGLRGGRDFGNHAWSVGGQVAVPVKRNLELRPSADLFFPSDTGMGWQANVDGAIRFGQGSVYGGGGLAIVHPADSDTKTGYNLFFGLTSPPGREQTRPFLEFRWTFVNDTNPFRLALGIMRRL